MVTGGGAERRFVANRSLVVTEVRRKSMPVTLLKKCERTWPMAFTIRSRLTPEVTRYLGQFLHEEIPREAGSASVTLQ